MGKIPNSLNTIGVCIKYIKTKKNNGHITYDYARFVQSDSSYYESDLLYNKDREGVEIEFCTLEEMKLQFPVHIQNSYYKPS
jgi:hypothetical protein